MKPIGLMTDSSTSNPFESYIEEVMLSEGFNAYEPVDLAKDRPALEDLKKRSVIIVSSSASKKLDTDVLEKYVSEGGCVVAVKPPVEWDYLFGLERGRKATYIKTADRYLVTNRSTHMSFGIVPEVIQFFGEADLYDVKDAVCINYISGAPERPSIYPGVAVSRYGRGRTAIFTYDLAECIVKMHQGNPENASNGRFSDPLSDGKYTAGDLFKGQFDYNFRLVPQADVHQDLLVRVINIFQNDSCPIPRLWHFPDGVPAVAFINGDSDGMTEDEFCRILKVVEDNKAKYTCYIKFDDQHALNSEKAKSLRQKGHDFGPHLFCGHKPGLPDMQKEVKNAVELFKMKYGYQPLTHRGHSCVWAGWVEMAKMLYESGIRIDTNFSPGVGIREGFLNGSALPVKFIDRNGKVIDVYEQSTQMTDDAPYSPKVLLTGKTIEEDIADDYTILNICLRYHGVFHHYFHPGKPKTVPRILEVLDELLKACNMAGVPFVNGSEWLDFNDAKRKVEFEKYDWDNSKGQLSFNIKSEMPVQGLTMMLPAKFEEMDLAGVYLDGLQIPFKVSSGLESTLYALIGFDAEREGNYKFEAVYT